MQYKITTTEKEFTRDIVDNEAYLRIVNSGEYPINIRTASDEQVIQPTRCAEFAMDATSLFMKSIGGESACRTFKNFKGILCECALSGAPVVTTDAEGQKAELRIRVVGGIPQMYAKLIDSQNLGEE